MFSRLSERLGIAREKWGLRALFAGRSRNGIPWESLEEVLIAGDVGVTMTDRVIDALRLKVSAGGPDVDPARLLSVVLRDMLLEVKGTGEPIRFSSSPTAVLLVGVNGSGKTTTAAKLSWNLGREGRKTILAAADTFQPGPSNSSGSGRKGRCEGGVSPSKGDPGAVVFDAIKATEARGCDCLIVDTAGRLLTGTT